MKLPTLPGRAQPRTPLTGAPPAPGDAAPDWRAEEAEQGPFDEAEPLWDDEPDVLADTFTSGRPPSARGRALLARRGPYLSWPIERIVTRSRQLTRPVEHLSRSRIVTRLSGGTPSLRMLVTALIIVLLVAGTGASALELVRLAPHAADIAHKPSSKTPSTTTAATTPTGATTPSPTVIIPQGGCFEGFVCADVGAEGNSGQAYTNGVMVLQSTGREAITGRVDAYHMVAKQMTGNFQVTAQLVAQSDQGDCSVPLNYQAAPSCPVADQLKNGGAWGPQAGLLIRADNSPGSVMYGIFQATEDNPEGPGSSFNLGPCQALPQQRVFGRTNTGGPATQWNRYCSTMLPQYLRIERQGDLFWAERSTDNGATWTFLDGSFVRIPALTGPVWAGVAMDSNTPFPGGQAGTASFAHFALDPFVTYAPGASNGGCPGGWACADIGGPGPKGGQSYSNGVLTLHGSGAGSNDIGGSICKMHYVWQDTGSSVASISARLNSIYVPNPILGSAKYPESGLVIQDTNDPGNDVAAAFEAENPFYALVAQNPSGLGNLSVVNVFSVYRPSPDGGSTMGSSITLKLPFWMKITRNGDAFAAYVSSDGVSWSLVPGSSVTIGGFSPGARLGLAGTGQLRGTTTVVFSNIATSGITPPS